MADNQASLRGRFLIAIDSGGGHERLVGGGWERWNNLTPDGSTDPSSSFGITTHAVPAANNAIDTGN